MQSTVDRPRGVIDDPSVELRIVSGNDPSPVSRADNEAFALIGSAVRAVCPEAGVAPHVMVQAGEARHCSQVCDSVYRFMPVDVTKDELAALPRRAGFFRYLIQHV